MATPNIVNKPVLLHGIGKGILITVSGKVLVFKTSQSMKLNVTASTDDVYGGDGLFPLYTYLTQKEGTIEIQDADFKLSQLAAAQQITYETTSQKRLMNKIVTKTDTSLGDDLAGVALVKCVGENGEPSTDVTVSDTGAITFSTSAGTGEYDLWYTVTETNAVTAEMLKNEMPEVAELYWKFTTEAQDGTKFQVDIHAPRVRSNGEFNIETARDSASTPTLTLNILDPGDDTENFASITLTQL